jgi:hypothetical protein
MRTRIQQRYEPAIVRWMLIALAVALVCLIATVAGAYPTCADSLAQSDPRGQSIAAGINYSILFMMAMPYTILATFCSVAYISIRRAQKKQASQEVLNEQSPVIS